MKKIILSAFLLGGMLGAVQFVTAQTTTYLCSGSGEHCMDVQYGDLHASFVKAKGKPAVVIKEPAH